MIRPPAMRWAQRAAGICLAGILLALEVSSGRAQGDRAVILDDAALEPSRELRRRWRRAVGPSGGSISRPARDLAEGGGR